MKHEIKVPRMGESISEATVGNILKASGSQVRAEEEVLELETDKVNQVLYAPAAGLLELTVKQDDVVKIGQVIGYVNTDAKGETKTESVIEIPKATKQEASKPKAEPAPAPKAKDLGVPVRAMKEEFLADVKRMEPTQQAPKVEEKRPVQTLTVGERTETRRKMTKIRRVIATRLVESLQTSAMLTSFNEVDMSAVLEVRANNKEEFAKKYNARLGFMPFFVKAVVMALKTYPELNSYIDGEEIVERGYYDIGIAVGTDRGLVVPVVRDCDKLSFGEIEQQIEHLAKLAREGGLSVDDLKGGSFTITNGGTYGSLLSTPILNPPQSGILGMHKIEKRAVVVDDAIVIRPMMYLALSYDHRLVDGKGAVGFLVHVKEHLEDPSRILLDI